MKNEEGGGTATPGTWEDGSSEQRSLPCKNPALGDTGTEGENPQLAGDTCAFGAGRRTGPTQMQNATERKPKDPLQRKTPAGITALP